MQTTYSATMNAQLVGQQADARPCTIVGRQNDEGTDIPFGIGVHRKAETTIEEPDDATTPFYGITMHTHREENQDLAGSDAIADDEMANIATSGAVVVATEETVVAGQRAYCRITSDSGSNTQLGKFRNDSDSGRCVPFPGFFDKCLSSTKAVLVFNCELPLEYNASVHDEVLLAVPQAQATASAIWFKNILSALYNFVITSVEYYNETGLAVSTSNSWSLQVLNAADEAADWGTETGEEGTIAADTPVALTLTSAKLTVAAGAAVTVKGTLTGSKTLPAGNFVIRGYLVK